MADTTDNPGPTRDRLLAAVRAAVLEHPLAELTPSEVARRAGVHRVTFYRHWPDLDAATLDAFTEELDRLSAVDDDTVAGRTDPAGLAQVYDGTLEGALTTILRERAAYRRLFAWPAFAERARTALRARAQRMVDTLTAAGHDVPGADGVAADVLAGASAAALAGWAASDDDDVVRRRDEIVAQLPSWWPRAGTR